MHVAVAESSHMQPLVNPVPKALVASGGLLSFVTTLLFFGWVLKLHVAHYGVASLWRWAIPAHWRRDHSGTSMPYASPQTQASASTTLQHLRTQFGSLFVNLAVADCVRGGAFMLNLIWIGRGTTPMHGTTSMLCDWQATCMTISNVASSFASIAIALYMLSIVFYKHRPPSKVIYTYIGAMWLLVLVISLIGPLAIRTPSRGPYYAWLGDWCFVSNAYQHERLATQYVFLLLAIGVNFSVYIILAAYLYRVSAKSKAATGSASTSVRYIANNMLLYSFTYVTLVMPIMCSRLATLAGHRWPRPLVVSFGFLLSLSGFANIVIYAWARKGDTSDSQLTHSLVAHACNSEFNQDARGHVDRHRTPADRISFAETQERCVKGSTLYKASSSNSDRHSGYNQHDLHPRFMAHMHPSIPFTRSDAEPVQWT